MQGTRRTRFCVGPLKSGHHDVPLGLNHCTFVHGACSRNLPAVRSLPVGCQVNGTTRQLALPAGSVRFKDPYQRLLSRSQSRNRCQDVFRPKGYSEETTMLPPAAVVSSRGLSEASSTRRGRKELAGGHEMQLFHQSATDDDANA